MVNLNAFQGEWVAVLENVTQPSLLWMSGYMFWSMPSAFGRYYSRNDAHDPTTGALLYSDLVRSNHGPNVGWRYSNSTEYCQNASHVERDVEPPFAKCCAERSDLSLIPVADVLSIAVSQFQDYKNCSMRLNSTYIVNGQEL